MVLSISNLPEVGPDCIIGSWALVAIDHFSRKVVASCPLEGPNAGWVVEALEEAFVHHGAPKHLITDQEKVFTSDGQFVAEQARLKFSVTVDAVALSQVLGSQGVSAPGTIPKVHAISTEPAKPWARY